MTNNVICQPRLTDLSTLLMAGGVAGGKFGGAAGLTGAMGRSVVLNRLMSMPSGFISKI